MKPCTTAIGVCALLLASGNALGAVTIWKSTTDTDFMVATNWSKGVVPGSSDRAIIRDSGANGLPVLSSGTPTVNEIDLTANALGNTVSLTITGGTLTANASLDVTAKEDIVSADATLHLNGGTLAFSTASLSLIGGDSSQANYGEAIFDFDSGSFSDNIDSMTIQGFATVDAEVSFTVVGDLAVDASTYASDAEIDMAASTTLTAGSVTIGDPSHAVKLTFTGAGSGGSASKLVTD